MQLGFLGRTPRGRIATKLAYEHLGVVRPDPGFAFGQRSAHILNMLIRGTKIYNLKHNENLPDHTESGKMINGQGRGAVSKYRYGICHMSFNGCEVIAVHNALVYLGIPEKLSDIAFYMERFRMLFGFFGCNPYKIGQSA